MKKIIVKTSTKKPGKDSGKKSNGKYLIGVGKNF